VLRQLAHSLRELSRDRDMLIRYGGEEFLLLLPGTNLAIAREIADRVRQNVQDNPIITAEHSLEIRLSAGVAEFQSEESPEELYGRADSALYSAKRGGRNRVEVAR